MSSITENLNPRQKDAVTSPEGPLLILAGAGSGKTRVLAHRIAFLAGSGLVEPSRIVGVTFTNKAAGEMRSRLDSLLGLGDAGPFLGTFHSFGARILRRHGGPLGLPRFFTILDEDDSVSLVKEILKEMGMTGEANAAEISESISAAKAEMKTPSSLSAGAASEREELAGRVWTRYEASKRSSQAVDFDDLIVLPVRLLEEHPEAAGAIHQEVKSVLVDEYQDTSPAQYRLLKALVGTRRSVTCVGDPDQSIYRWRGADIRNILEFEKDFPEAKVVTLEQNYRSTGLILEAATELISHNIKRKPKELWTEGERGSPIAFHLALDQSDEARFVASAAAQWTRRGSSPGDFAVLYRTNAQSRILEEAFMQNRVPYRMVGTVRFYARREVKDMLSYLRLLVNPADAVSLSRALSSPPRGVGDSTVAKLVAAARDSGQPVLELIASPEGQALTPARGRGALRGFLEFISKLAASKAEAGFAHALRETIDGSGYLDWMSGKGKKDSDDRRENLRELLSAAESFEEGGASLEGFLEQAALMSDMDRWRGEEEAVSLMTLHNAKGLEFPNIFVCGLEEGLLPHTSAFVDDDDMEEERRLFYVGLTRAKGNVALTAARGRRMWDKFQWGSLSRFLKEIPASLMRTIESPESLPLGEENLESVRERAPEPDPHPDYDSSEDRGIVPGALVRHPRFGEGKVTKISGSGAAARITVSFARFGRKVLLAGMARFSFVRNPR